MYQAEHEDESPPDLATLIQENFTIAKMLISPISGREPPKVVDGKLVGEIDYVYIRLPANPDSPGQLIRAYERPENYHNKGTNVLFADGRIGWISRPEFEQALERTKEYIKTAESDTEDF